MSMWTHITACISVETGIEEKDIRRRVRSYISKGPKITGSEMDADIFINVPSGHNVWMSADCDHCPYGHTRKWVGKGEFECTHPDSYKCQSGEYQTCVVISIQGDLRDRMESETKKEFDEFLSYLKKKYYIRDYAVNIEGD